MMGTPVIYARHLKRGEAYWMNGSVVMHWLDAAMMLFDPEEWWEATPAENARRIRREVEEIHRRLARSSSRRYGG